jgi:hypothetical protein
VNLTGLSRAYAQMLGNYQQLLNINKQDLTPSFGELIAPSENYIFCYDIIKCSLLVLLMYKIEIL